MSAIFGSARAALAYLYSCRRGPQLARPKYNDCPPSTGHSHWDHVLVGALLYGDLSDGKCGIEPGGDLDARLQEWALDRDARMDDDVADVVAQLGRLLTDADMRPAQVEVPRVFRWTEDDGRVCIRAMSTPVRNVTGSRA